MQILLLTLILLVVPGVLQAAQNVTGVAFYRAIRDQASFAKNPTNYDRHVVMEATGKIEYYVERQPAHIIPKLAIESIIMRETKQLIFPGEAIKQKLPASYDLTFKIRPPHSKNFSAFTKKNQQGYFAIRFSEEIVAVIHIFLPFDPDDDGSLEFKLFFLDESSESKFAERLSPFKDILRRE